MRRQQHTGIQGPLQVVVGSKNFTLSRTPQYLPMNTTIFATQADPATPELTIGMSIETRQYSLTERKLRATAFATRVHSLKYYIGLIGSTSII
jgi:hypothetical protein